MVSAGLFSVDDGAAVERELHVLETCPPGLDPAEVEISVLVWLDNSVECVDV